MENNFKCWINESDSSDFSIHNIPFGIVKFQESLSVASRIGNNVILIDKLSELGYLKNVKISPDCFKSNFLNSLMKNGKAKTSELRKEIISIFTSDELRNNEQHKKKILKNIDDVEMQMPIEIGDYTDFYSSIEHATNVGAMFRDPDNALLPNWKYIPVGYHGRASSIILSGQEIHRPKGQIKPNEDEPPIFSPCRLLDFELEMAFITFGGKPLGQSISTNEADDYIFGMCLFNDWSARDIQKWEYVPLGPFLAKNFASSMSPWIITLDALEPFRVEGPKQEPEVFDYLKYKGNKNIDIHLEVIIKPENSEEKVVSKSNYKYMYWNMNQQLAHHTVNGCNIRCGDVMASGTISGPTPDSYGSMLELSWKGTKPIPMPDGSERKFINDFDTVIMKGYCEKENIRVGFGEVSTKVLPAI